MPLSEVVPPPGQSTCWRQRFVQLLGTPQTLGIPPPPHVSGALHLPQLSAFPQPSPAGPHVKPRLPQVAGVQVLVPHLPGPPPPHVSVPMHGPQSRGPPQPSPAGPH